MFVNPSSGALPTTRMQAFLLVRSRLGFIFDASMTALDRFNAMTTAFHQKIYTLTYQTKIRFVLVASGPSPFPRIAVLFQPLYAVADDSGPPNSLKAGALNTPALISAADLVFDIAKTATPLRANPFLSNKIPTARGTRLNVMTTDFTFELALRLVLGVPTALPGGAGTDQGVIRNSDLNGLARLVEQQLGEPANSRQIQIFP